MMTLSKEECKNIIAGSISGKLLSAITKLINSVLDIGRACGSAIRRLVSNKSCELK